MIFVEIAAYFMVVITATALVALPSVRGGVLRTLNAFCADTRDRAVHGSTRMSAQSAQFVGLLRVMLIRGWRWSARRRLPILAAAGILAAPSLVAIALHGRQTFQYNDDLRVPDSRIAVLLNGEQLVPPPPLPPDAFLTQEVEQVRPSLGEANRDWNLLDADFRKRLLLVYQIMREQNGYEMVLLEGYRSPERQNRLAGMGSNVTNVAAFQSYHQYGLAADSAFLRDGKIVISEKDPWAMRGYQLYGQVAEQVGLTWGGRWKMKDLGHIEYHKPGFAMTAGR